MISIADTVQKRRSTHGLEWMVELRPELRPFVSHAMFRMIINTSAQLAVDEARQSGKTYVLASSSVPCLAIYVLAAGHPRLASHPQMTIRYQFSPSGEIITLPWMELAGKGGKH
jgi:hypothetical protein